MEFFHGTAYSPSGYPRTNVEFVEFLHGTGYPPSGYPGTNAEFPVPDAPTRDAGIQRHGLKRQDSPACCVSLYPTPGSVMMSRGIWGFSSIFLRNPVMYTRR